MKSPIRTEAQINKAKYEQALRLGGTHLPKLKRKKCKMGKSCGAACIDGAKVCMVDIPWALGKALSEAVDFIYASGGPKSYKTVQVKTPSAKKPKPVPAPAPSKTPSKAPTPSPTPSPTPTKAPVPTSTPALSPASTPTPKPQPKQKPPSKPPIYKRPVKFVKSKGPEVQLSEMNTSEQMGKKADDSKWNNNKPAQTSHNLIGYVFGKGLNWADSATKALNSKLQKLRNKVADRLGGEPELAKSLSAVRKFTGATYSDIRKAQKLDKAGVELSADDKKYLRMGERIDRFIAAMPKQKVEKFRGYRTTDEKLKEMIEDSKKRHRYSVGAVSSWSTSLDTSVSFANKKPAPDLNNRIILRTINKAGVAVERLTSITGEYEILTSGKSQLQFTGNYREIEHNGYKYHVFDMIEYAP